MAVPRVRARVTGRVQGVFYRASTVQEAARLGLVGWVRNEPDGSVLIEAQGQREGLERLLAWCGKGPPGARVSRVDPDWVDEMSGETTFRVR